MKIRGTLTLVFLAVVLLAADVVQRLVIAPLVRLFPSRRHPLLGAWQQLMARTVLGAVRFIGGARIEEIPRIPNGPGVLILMNHQSLLDIPLVVFATRPRYPRIVTRERYASGKPLISHMIRLYQYPTVNPRATGREDLSRLRDSAAASPVPMVIYPEGTRTRDGGIGRFRRAGLRAILPARDWEVWVVTADGFWECARLADFRANVSSVHGAVKVDGPFEGPGAGASQKEVDAFIRRMEDDMRASLEALREQRRLSGTST